MENRSAAVYLQAPCLWLEDTRRRPGVLVFWERSEPKYLELAGTFSLAAQVLEYRVSLAFLVSVAEVSVFFLKLVPRKTTRPPLFLHRPPRSSLSPLQPTNALHSRGPQTAHRPVFHV